MDTELSERLRRHFQLKYALVVPGPLPTLPRCARRSAGLQPTCLPRPRVRSASVTGRPGGGYPNWPGW